MGCPERVSSGGFAFRPQFVRRGTAHPFLLCCRGLQPHRRRDHPIQRLARFAGSRSGSFPRLVSTGRGREYMRWCRIPSSWSLVLQWSSLARRPASLRRGFPPLCDRLAHPVLASLENSSLGHPAPVCRRLPPSRAVSIISLPGPRRSSGAEPQRPSRRAINV